MKFTYVLVFFSLTFNGLLLGSTIASSDPAAFSAALPSKGNQIAAYNSSLDIWLRSHELGKQFLETKPQFPIGKEEFDRPGGNVFDKYKKFYAIKTNPGSGVISAEALANAKATGAAELLEKSGLSAAVLTPSPLSAGGGNNALGESTSQGSPITVDNLADTLKATVKAREDAAARQAEEEKRRAQEAQRQAEDDKRKAEADAANARALSAAGGGVYTNPEVLKLHADISGDEKVKFNVLEFDDHKRTVRFSGRVLGEEIPVKDYNFDDPNQYQSFKIFMNVIKATRSNNFAAAGDAMAGIFNELFSAQKPIEPVRLQELEEMQSQMTLAHSLLSANSARSTVQLPFGDNLQLSYQTREEFDESKKNLLSSVYTLLEKLRHGKVYASNPKFKQFVEMLDIAMRHSLVPEFTASKIQDLLQDIGLLLPFEDNRESKSKNMVVKLPVPYNGLAEYCATYAAEYKLGVDSIISVINTNHEANEFSQKLLTPQQLIQKLFSLAQDKKAGIKTKDQVVAEAKQVVWEIIDATEKILKVFNNIAPKTMDVKYKNAIDSLLNFKAKVNPLKSLFFIPLSDNNFGETFDVSRIFPALTKDNNLQEEVRNIMSVFQMVAPAVIKLLGEYQLLVDNDNSFIKEFLRFTYSSKIDLPKNSLKSPSTIDLVKMLNSSAAAQELLYIADTTIALQGQSVAQLKLGANVVESNGPKTAMMIDAIEFFTGPLLTEKTDPKKPLAESKRLDMIVARAENRFPAVGSLTSQLRMESNQLNSREALWQFAADYSLLFPKDIKRLDVLVENVSKRLAQKGTFKTLESELLDLSKSYMNSQQELQRAIEKLARQSDIQLPQLQQTDPEGNTVATRVLAQLMVARNVAKKFTGVEPGIITALDVRSVVDDTRLDRFLSVPSYYFSSATPSMNLNDIIMPLQWFRVFTPAESAIETALAALRKNSNHSDSADDLNEFNKVVREVSHISGKFLGLIDKFIVKYKEFLEWKRSVTPGGNTINLAGKLKAG